MNQQVSDRRARISMCQLKEHFLQREDSTINNWVNEVLTLALYIYNCQTLVERLSCRCETASKWNDEKSATLVSFSCRFCCVSRLWLLTSSSLASHRQVRHDQTVAIGPFVMTNRPRHLVPSTLSCVLFNSTYYLLCVACVDKNTGGFVPLSHKSRLVPVGWAHDDSGNMFHAPIIPPFFYSLVRSAT